MSFFVIPRDRDPPHDQAEDDEVRRGEQVHPALEAEDGVADELDAMAQRIENARICAHCGNSSSGKNEPASRNNGVSTALTT